MNTYLVDINGTYSLITEIYANSEEEAIEEAKTCLEGCPSGVQFNPQSIKVLTHQ